MLSVPSGKYADINKAGYFGHVILSAAVSMTQAAGHVILSTSLTARSVFNCAVYLSR